MISTITIAEDLTVAGVEQKQAKAHAEARLVRWIVGAGFVYTGLLLAVIRLMLPS